MTAGERIRSRRIELGMTQEELAQDIINCMVKKGFSSKTIRNKLSFVSSVINYSGNAVPSYRLPQRKRPELNIPDDTTMKQIFKIIKDTDMEIPVMLASFGAMRRGEICSLTMDDIKKNTVHVYKSIVRGPDNKLHIKPPKTFTSDRYIEFPDFVISKIKKQGYVTNMNPNTLSKRFSQMLKVNNIPHFRFHDLRHYAASSMHAAGIPDAYIMRVGGWSSTSVLDNVYRHALTDQQKEMSDKSIEHFKSLF